MTVTPDAPRPDLDDAERDEAEREAAASWALREINRLRAALADAQAEVARLRAAWAELAAKLATLDDVADDLDTHADALPYRPDAERARGVAQGVRETAGQLRALAASAHPGRGRGGVMDLADAERRSKYPHEPDMPWDEIEERLRTADQAAVYQVFAYNDRVTDLVARNGEELSQLRAALAERDAEIARLRGEVERYEVLTPQVCPAGEHPEWLIDSEHHHACPWCEIARLREAIRSELIQQGMEVIAELDHLRALAAAPAPADGSLLAERDAEIAQLTGEVARLRAAVVARLGTAAAARVFALAAAPAPAEDERVDTCGVCGTDLLDADTSELHWGLCPPCFTAQIDAPAREQADPADEEGECPPICGALGSIHGPGHPCTMPPGHTLHRDGVGCSWAEPDTPAEGVAALLRRCDEVEADPRGGWLLLTHDIRALLGGGQR